MDSQTPAPEPQPDETPSQVELNIGSGQVTDSTVSVGDVAGGDIHKHTHIHPAPTPTQKPPRTLPGASRVFLGREDELSQLLDALAPDPNRAHAVLIHGIRGMGGVGKTELALQAAWKLAEQYPDGQIFLECQVSTWAKSSQELLGELVQAFQPEASLPPDEDQRQALARRVLGGRRGLLVLDNAADGRQVAPVLAAVPGGWAVLVTSRRRFGLQGGSVVDLNVLSPQAAVALLVELLGSRNEDQARLAELARLCGHLPLALRIGAAFLANHPDWSLAEYFQALERERLRHLQEEGEGDVASVLGLSLAQLRERDRALVARWHALAVFPAPFDRALAAAVWEVEEHQARESLSRLVGWSRLEYDQESGLYSLHDLLRALASPPDP